MLKWSSGAGVDARSSGGHVVVTLLLETIVSSLGGDARTGQDTAMVVDGALRCLQAQWLDLGL